MILSFYKLILYLLRINLLTFLITYYIVNCKKRCKFINSKPWTSMSETQIPQNLNYRQNQVFGADQPFQTIQQQDIINSIQFDSTGQYLAIGDHAGRVILFKQQQDEFGDKNSFQYFSQFQSHQPQFDSLKSYTMSQSINQIRWLRDQGKYKKMVTSNNNRIKLWKMFQKQQTKVVLTSERDSHLHEGHDFALPLLNRQMIFTVNPQAIFPIKHKGVINHIDISKNQQFLFSTDQQQAMVWNFQKFDLPFIVQQTKNKKNWNQSQKITSSKLHPLSENMFLCGTSKGRIQLNDLRTSINNRKNISFLCQNKGQKDSNYFTEMTSGINSLQFISQGKYVVARDYLSIKIWDLCRLSSPLDIIYTNQFLKQKLCNLFQNDCMQDQFKISSFSQNLIISGSYHNRFNIIDPLNSKNIEYQMQFDGKYTKKCLKSSKNPFPTSFNFNRKVSKCAVHKQTKKIGLASLNSFFIYTPQI